MVERVDFQDSIDLHAVLENPHSREGVVERIHPQDLTNVHQF